MHIDAGDGKSEQIPCIEELLELLQDKVREDAAFKLNIELKNSVYPYPGMEEKIVDLVRKVDCRNISYILHSMQNHWRN